MRLGVWLTISLGIWEKWQTALGVLLGIQERSGFWDLNCIATTFWKVMVQYRKRLLKGFITHLTDVWFFAVTWYPFIEYHILIIQSYLCFWAVCGFFYHLPGYWCYGRINFLPYAAITAWSISQYFVKCFLSLHSTYQFCDKTGF